MLYVLKLSSGLVLMQISAGEIQHSAKRAKERTTFNHNKKVLRAISIYTLNPNPKNTFRKRQALLHARGFIGVILFRL